MNTLPTPDQPDNYTGHHTATRVTWVSLETTPHGHYTGHLMPGASPTRPTGSAYCARLNPRLLIDLTGVKYSTSHGGYGLIDCRGAVVGWFLDRPSSMRYMGTPVKWCPDCVTMAAAEAEMVGQRAYPVRTLVGRLMEQRQRH